MKNDQKYKSFELLGYLNREESNNIKKVILSGPGKWSVEKGAKSLLAGKGRLTVNQRNHLRLVLQKTGRTLALVSLERQNEWIPYFYLSELLQRNAFLLFDKELKKHYKHLRKNGLALHCLMLKDLELDRMVTEAVFSKKSVDRICGILEDMDALRREYEVNLDWRTESYKVFLKSFSASVKTRPVQEMAQPSGLWQKIYALRHKAFSTPGIEEKTVILRRLYRLTAAQPHRLFQRETATTCSNLATYYMILGKFDLSMSYFTKAMKLKKYFRPANYLMLQFNYVGLSLRNLQFDTAYRIMLDVDEGIQSMPAVAFKWKLLKSMCCVFAGKEKEIPRILPAVPDKKDARDYIYFYAVWAIYFTHTGKSETAMQMLDTGRGLARRHRCDASLETFIAVSKKYHLWLNKHSASTAAVKTLVLYKKIDLGSLSAGNILPLIWFKNYLQKQAV